MDKLLKEYEEKCIQHSIYFNDGDSKNANKLHKKITMIYKKIVKVGTLTELEIFLEHENFGVRRWAAMHTYKIDPKRSLEVLEGLTEEKSSIGLSTILLIEALKSERKNE